MKFFDNNWIVKPSNIMSQILRLLDNNSKHLTLTSHMKVSRIYLTQAAQRKASSLSLTTQKLK